MASPHNTPSTVTTSLQSPNNAKKESIQKAFQDGNASNKTETLADIQAPAVVRKKKAGKKVLKQKLGDNSTVSRGAVATATSQVTEPVTTDSPATDPVTTFSPVTISETKKKTSFHETKTKLLVKESIPKPSKSPSSSTTEKNAKMCADIRAFCKDMDGAGLYAYFMAHEVSLYPIAQISTMFGYAPDPAKLVLDAVICDSDEKHRISIFMLEILCDLSPIISAEVRENAMKLVLEWIANMPSGEGLTSEPLAILRLVVCYQLTSEPTELDLCQLLDIVVHIASSQKTVGLLKTLDLPDRIIHDFINKLIESKRHSTALTYVYEFGLVKSFPPVNILHKFKKHSEEAAAEARQNTSLVAAEALELSILYDMVRNIEKYSLSEYPREDLEKRIKKLEDKRERASEKKKKERAHEEREKKKKKKKRAPNNQLGPSGSKHGRSRDHSQPSYSSQWTSNSPHVNMYPYNTSSHQYVGGILPQYVQGNSLQYGEGMPPTTPSYRPYYPYNTSSHQYVGRPYYPYNTSSHQYVGLPQYVPGNSPQYGRGMPPTTSSYRPYYQ